MTPMGRPSFTYETMEMKEKILVRDWMNWIINTITKKKRTAKEFAQLMKSFLKYLPKNSQMYQQYKGIMFLFY